MAYKTNKILGNATGANPSEFTMMIQWYNFFVQKMLNVFLEWSLDSSKTKQIQNIALSETLCNLNK